jgi:hypothetical protein
MSFLECAEVITAVMEAIPEDSLVLAALLVQDEE